MIQLRRSFLWVICVTTALTLAVPARADNKEDATKHFRAGLELIEQKDFASAAQEFETSVELYPTKNALFNLANCYKVLYQYGEALEAVDKLKRLFRKDFDEKWIVEVQTLEQDLASSMARLEIRVDVDGASILVDGQKAGESPLGSPLSLPPGEHKIEVIHKQHGVAERQVTLKNKGETVESFVLLPSEPPSPSSETSELDVASTVPAPAKRKRPWTWVSLGVGGAGLVGAVVTGALASSKAATVKDHCDSTTCDPAYRDEHESATKLGVAANVLTGVAIAGVAVGAVLFFVEDRPKEQKTAVSLVPVWSSSSAGLQLVGRF